MKAIIIFLLFSFFYVTGAVGRDYYQIRVYRIKDNTQGVMVEKYLKDSYLPALHRAGVKKAGVFKPIKGDPAEGTRIFVFIPLKSIGQIEDIENAISKDKQHLESGADFLNTAWNNPPYERMESILLKAFAEMPSFAVPSHKTAPSERIYELRSYEGPTEKLYRKKVEMFNEGGEVALFEKLDFQAVFYGEVISGSAMPNLMYMTTFPDMKVHDEKWDTFRNHPDWKILSGKEEYKNTVSHSDKYLLHPTDYSDI